MMTAQNLALHELIGLRARVAESASRPHKGLSGLVVDETKNTLVIRVGKVEKTVPKKGSVFLFTLPGGEKVRLEGGRIAYRPYDRPKKLR
ncbi:MAG: ribonuclease P protein component 1 [Candidatus Micrarchaeia archaeon]|jgi:ribonuclease P protein subunit POP4